MDQYRKRIYHAQATAQFVVRPEMLVCRAGYALPTAFGPFGELHARLRIGLIQRVRACVEMVSVLSFITVTLSITCEQSNTRTDGAASAHEYPLLCDSKTHPLGVVMTIPSLSAIAALAQMQRYSPSCPE